MRNSCATGCTEGWTDGWMDGWMDWGKGDGEQGSCNLGYVGGVGGKGGWGRKAATWDPQPSIHRRSTDNDDVHKSPPSSSSPPDETHNAACGSQATSTERDGM
eukprot:364054-Chlamydomonas_euryale.AAC.1